MDIAPGQQADASTDSEYHRHRLGAVAGLGDDDHHDEHPVGGGGGEQRNVRVEELSRLDVAAEVPDQGSGCIHPGADCQRNHKEQI